MSKSLISDRIIFSSKESQTSFLGKIRKYKNKSLKDLAVEWEVHRRTLSDWVSGEHHMPYDLALINAKQCHIKLPRGVRRLKWEDHAIKAGMKGAKMNLLKNGKIGGDEKYRKEKWRAWWENKGKLIPFPILQAKEISLPGFSKELAEFIGIMLGDGNIAPYAVKISLNKSELKYVDFVSKLIEKLFKVGPKIFFNKKSNGLNIVVQRRKLVEFLKEVGLPIGHKIEQGADVPVWIMKDIEFQTACIRGLIDTDGCIFIHKYKSNGKIYQYKKIDFTNVSRPLLDSAYKILINLGIGVRICKNGKALRIEKESDVAKYLKIVGTNNARYS